MNKEETKPKKSKDAATVAIETLVELMENYCLDPEIRLSAATAILNLAK